MLEDVSSSAFVRPTLASTIRSVVEQGLIVLASERDADRAAFWGIGMVDGAPFPALG